MSVNGNFVDITLDDFRLMGDRLGVPDIEITLSEVAASVASWREFAAQAMIDPISTDEIASDLEEVTTAVRQ
jgi:hypothetical protein